MCCRQYAKETAAFDQKQALATEFVIKSTLRDDNACAFLTFRFSLVLFKHNSSLFSKLSAQSSQDTLCVSPVLED